MPDYPALIDILKKVKALVSRPENVFDWSGWEDSVDACQEIDAAIAALERQAGVPRSLDILFLPTGPLQELAMSSGWGDEFLGLADEFDTVMAVKNCRCLSEPPRATRLVRSLGMDEDFGTSEVVVCPECGLTWLRLAYEIEAFTGSGRWFLGVVDNELAQTVESSTARTTMESLPEYFIGGSWLEGKVVKSSGPVNTGP